MPDFLNWVLLRRFFLFLSVMQKHSKHGKEEHSHVYDKTGVGFRNYIVRHPRDVVKKAPESEHLARRLNYAHNEAHSRRYCKNAGNGKARNQNIHRDESGRVDDDKPNRNRLVFSLQIIIYKRWDSRDETRKRCVDPR